MVSSAVTQRFCLNPAHPGLLPGGTCLQRRPASTRGKPRSAVPPPPRAHGAGDPWQRRGAGQAAGHRRAATTGGRRDRRLTTLREGGPAALGHDAAPPLLPARRFLRGGGGARSGLLGACRCSVLRSVLRPALERGLGRGGTPVGQAGRSGRKVTRGRRVPGRARRVQHRRAELGRGLESRAAEVRSESLCSRVPAVPSSTS